MDEDGVIAPKGRTIMTNEEEAEGNESLNDSLYDDANQSTVGITSTGGNILNVTKDTLNESDLTPPSCTPSSIANGLKTVLGMFRPADNDMSESDLLDKLSRKEDIEPPNAKQLLNLYNKEGMCERLAAMLRIIYKNTAAVVAHTQTDPVLKLQEELHQARATISELELELRTLKSTQLSNIKDKIRETIRDELSFVEPNNTVVQSQPADIQQASMDSTEFPDPNLSANGPVNKNKVNISTSNTTFSPTIKRQLMQTANQNAWQLARGPKRSGAKAQGSAGLGTGVGMSMGGPGRKSLCDPRRTVRIRGVLNYEKYLAKSYLVLDEFNIHYPNMPVDQCKPTFRGSLLIELKSPTDADKVVSEWQPDFFGGAGAVTSAVLLASTGSSHRAVMDNVPPELPEKDIEEACTKELKTTPKVYRFLFNKTGERRFSVRLEFESEELKDKAISTGLNIGTRHFGIREFVEKRGKKPHQCPKCFGFNHWPAWCNKKQACGKCGDVEGTHQATTCTATTEYCLNCKGGHAATSTSCPVYKAFLNQTQDG